MKRSLLRSVAASSLFLLAGAGLHASSRPHYGGSVRILLRDRVTSLDPQADVEHAGARDRITSLIYETLTTIDSQGRVRPRLATSWQAGPGNRSWQFNLRLENFHDGTAVTSAEVVSSLQAAAPQWKITANGKQALTIEAPAPIPHMPELLAEPRFAVLKRLPDGTLVGSGPFKLTEWQQGERALLSANEDYWAGRAYPDTIEFQMGTSLRDHLLERNLGRDSAAEINIDQARGLDQGSQNVLVSRPSDLLVLLFLHADLSAGGLGHKPVDPKLREALADAVDRSAISNVLLQRRSSPAGGLLPQWLTGVEFLFSASPDPDRARTLRADAGAVPPITLAYDFSDPVAKLVADRIAVDAREAGIVVQPYGDPHTGTRSARSSLNADAVLLRLPLRSVEPATALAGLAEDLNFPTETISSILSATRAEDLYDLERRALDDFRIIPIAHVSELVWVNANVHNWQQLPQGDWKLDELWVEGTK